MRFFYGVLGLFIFLGYAAAQDVPVKVSVNDTVYVVQGSSVSDQNGKQESDIFVARKALLAASVLDSQILHSDFNRQLYDAANRATVFADEASGRSIEPWRRPILNGSPDEKALAAAKEEFRVWATKLINEPAQSAFSIAQQDYGAGLGAFRDSAAIYRSVTKHGEILTYDEALEFLQNQRAIVRLLNARGLETRLAGSTKSSDVAGPDQGGFVRFSQRLQNEVVNRIEAIKTVGDLEKSNATIRKIAVAEIASLKAYDANAKPAIIRLNPANSKGGAASAGGTAAQTIKIAVPFPKLKAGQRVDITGGILPSPYPNQGGSAAGGNRPSNDSASAGNAGGGSGPGTPSAGSPSLDTSNFAGSASGQPSGANAQSGLAAADQKAGDGDVAGDPNNLLTYSSKPYHSGDGWRFNPLNGLWENPTDPAETRIPSVITCCDDTGLAFPNEAVEAQAYWDGGGVDPNCGRLYRCGDAGKTDPPPPDPNDPTDKDAEILAVLNYINSLPISDEEKRKLSAEVVTKFGRQYWHRARQLRRTVINMSATRASTSRAIAGPSGSSFRAAPYSNNTVNHSTITGLGGVSSHYEPITRAAASDVVGRYKSIPGGVTLEGASDDLSFVTKVTYLKGANAFVINDDLIYINPVSSAEYLGISRALAKDSRLGVSLGDVQIVYGALSPRSEISWILKIADRFLGSLVFVNRTYLPNYKTAPGYRDDGQKYSNVAVYFRFDNYGFSQDSSGELRRSRANLRTTLVPLTANKNSEGGHLPDFDRIERNDLPSVYVDNLKHLQVNFGYYAREKIVRRAIAYGEAAAFARSLLASGVKAEIE